MKNLIGIPETARGIGIGSDVVFNIHDSCVTRDETSHHESVRWVLDELGYNWTEIERNGKKHQMLWRWRYGMQFKSGII